MRREAGSWRHRRSGAAALLLLLTASAAPAHDTWILPAHVSIAAGAPLALEATSGMGFPATEFAILPERVSAARVRLAGKTSDLAAAAGGKRSLHLSTIPAGEGIACVWLETKPKSIDLKPAQVREYLEEIGADESVGRTWSATPGGRWRELYSKHAKTFVAVGVTGADADRSWETPVGMRLEIVPESDPIRVRAGDRLAVRLLRDGLPAAGFPLGMVLSGEKAGVLRKTDPEGRAVFELARKGWVLIRATELRRCDSPDCDWTSDFSTLTLRVLERIAP